ncbi:MAG: ribosome recycling factor [Opitutales bacterium]
MTPDDILKSARADMQKSVDHTLSEFNTLHTGKASPSMVEGVSIEAYGSSMKIRDVAAITTPDSRTIVIQPWDKSVIKNVEKGILAANIGFTPAIDGGLVRINIPELSKDRRRELAKVAGNMAENGRVGVRAARRDAMDALKGLKGSDVSEDDLKRYEKEVQKLTDDSIAEIGKHLEAKEAELLKV